MKKKVILIIRDGWGYSEDEKNNAILTAKTPFTDQAEKEYPTILLNASGKYVGLPDGFMGNSEVGHMTIGSGKKVEQSLLRINKTIEDNSFLINRSILEAIVNAKENKATLHLIILLQDAGVHSHIDHLFKTLDYAKKEGLKNDQVVIHVITDGRDEEPESGIDFLSQVAEAVHDRGVGIVATISGRYYSMDRNQNWERTELAYKAIVDGVGREFKCGLEELEKSYENNITDEFIKPMVKIGYKGMKDNDSVFFLNFRKDRSRQLTESILDKNFKEFEKKQKEVYFLAMTNYNKALNLNVVFDDVVIENTITEVLDKNNKKQLRISETEKYAHVTYFFNGGKEYDSENIDKILIPSPGVATYDLQPEMNIKDLNSKVLEKINNELYDFILLNYPNPDMVGHTGNFDATVKAVEAVDISLENVIKCGLEKEYIILLTADHGNAENVSKNFTRHTLNKVPFTLISKESFKKENYLKNGEFGLSNIMATILKIMDIKKPQNIDKDLFD